MQASLLWLHHWSYSNEAKPPNPYTTAHLQGIEPCQHCHWQCYVSNYSSVAYAFMCMCIRAYTTIFLKNICAVLFNSMCILYDLFFMLSTHFGKQHKKKICKQCRHVIGTIHPIALVRTGVGKLLGILNQCDQVLLGICAPHCLHELEFRTSYKCVVLLLTLAKLGDPDGIRTSDSHVRSVVLQSTELHGYKLFGVGRGIRTLGFTVLQTVALGLSATPTLFGADERTRTVIRLLDRQLVNP